jgi:pimeloyl-ACP methyl ester carboxylesterase
MAIPTFEIEFTKSGRLFDPTAVDTAVAGLGQTPGEPTDLIVFVHGWNDDKEDARRLRQAFFSAVEALAAQHAPAGRRFAVLAPFWPSKRFADADLIPGGGAVALGEEEMQILRRLEAMKVETVRLGVEREVDHHRMADLDLAKAQVPRLAHDADAQRQLVGILRAFAAADGLSARRPSPEDASDSFFDDDPVALLDRLSTPVPPPALPAGFGGAAGLGGAAGIGDLGRSLLAGARRLLNYTTYYQMKERAGLIGNAGLAPVVRTFRQQHPALKIHLVGHSFGGRLVTAAADALNGAAHPASLTLLQAAFSHNGFARQWDGQHDGFFRKVVSERKIAGPILITHTKNDRAVGIAYPLASRVAHQNAAAVGDAADPYGGMGRNGAQHTPEASAETLREVGADYPFAAGKVFNLNADAVITRHDDVAGPQVAFALLKAVGAT